MIPPGQPSLFLLSGSGGAAGSKAKRPCTSATKSRGSLPTPAPHFLAQSCSAFPGCRGEQARVGRLHTPFRKARAAEGTMTAAYHSRGALTRRTGASRGWHSVAGWASPPGTPAASCRRAGTGRDCPAQAVWGSLCSWRRPRGCWSPHCRSQSSWRPENHLLLGVEPAKSWPSGGWGRGNKRGHFCQSAGPDPRHLLRR